MRKFTIILLALVMAFSLTVKAEAEDTLFSIAKVASVIGDVAVAAPGISGFQFVLDYANMVSGSDSDATLTTYRNRSGTLLASATVAASVTTVTVTNTTSAAIARTGDIIYEISRATDPSQVSFIFHGVVASSALSDAADVESIVRVASNSESAITTLDAITIGVPLIGTRGTGARNLWTGIGAVPTDDNKKVLFVGDVAAHSATMGMPGSATGALVYPTAMFPFGMISRDYIVRFNTGNGTDGEIELLNGHYTPRR